MLRRALTIGSLFIFLGMGLGGCGGGSDGRSEISFKPFNLEAPDAPNRREEQLEFAADGLVGTEPKPIIPERSPPEFLITQDLIDGFGKVAREGDTVTVQYVGYLYDSRKKFASSWEQGKPFTFTLGAGEVMEGWEQGVEGMEVSDQRELVIPPALTKGGTKMKGVPQGETLVYVLDLIDLKHG